MKDLARFTLEEKVGQLFFLGFRGEAPDQESRSLLDDIRPGGVVLSQRNIHTFDQTADLIEQLAARESIPLIAINQEGGAVDRLKPLFGELPSPAEAALGGVSQIRALGRLLASELECLGFNTLFGPVLDLAIPGSVMLDRTLPATPKEVSRLGRAFLDEVQQRGILPCPGHFPGLGAATRDPHFGLPVIERPKKQLWREDIVPFADLLHAPLMMVGHGHYPAFQDGRPWPASLTPRVVEGLLRRKLGYSGVIITGDLTMGAVSSMGLTKERFLEAIEAGNDMLLFSETTPLVHEAFMHLTSSARKSAALRNRIDRSLARILSLKSALPPRRHHRAHARARLMRQISRFRTVLAQPALRRSPVAS
jgi:beta-N-acetylhexosaminidase